MASNLTYFLLFLLPFLFFSGGTTSPAAGPADVDADLATITVTSVLPQIIPKVELYCSFNGGAELQLRPLEGFGWSIQTAGVYYCKASWGSKLGVWDAYEPGRDAGHRSVNWEVKQEGFFLSWDNSTWTKQGDWETN